MKKINLREYYSFYTKDVIIEVPDEVADILREYTLLEEAYRIRTYRHKAFFSLDYDSSAEHHILPTQPSPYEILEQRRRNEQLYKGLATLSEKQRQRIYAHYFLGMKIVDIAKADGCSFTSVKESIERGLRKLEKFFEKNNANTP